MSGEPANFNARATARWLASCGRPHTKRQPPGSAAATISSSSERLRAAGAGALALPMPWNAPGRHREAIRVCVAVAFAEPTRMIRAAGHEIGHHGWVHENPAMLTPEPERYVLERGFEALDRIAGVRPVGYRSQNGHRQSNLECMLTRK